jgi:Bacterial Ig-like domain
LLCPGFACGDLGRHLIVVVGDVILGDVVGGGVPHAIVAENIAQRLDIGSSNWFVDTLSDTNGGAGGTDVYLSDQTLRQVTEALVADSGSSSSDGITLNPAVTGAGNPNAAVTIKEGSATLGTTTADGLGNWTFTPTLTDGLHTLVATETNAAGTGTASLTFTLDRTAPPPTEALVSDTGSSSSDKITANPAVTGSGEPNAVVVIEEGSTSLGTTTANSSGVWRFTPTLTGVTHTLTATETDVAGNTGAASSLTFTLDTTIPALGNPLPWIKHGGTFQAGEAQYADLNGDGKADLIMQGLDDTFWVSLSPSRSRERPESARSRKPPSGGRHGKRRGNLGC